jgi:hypothetical protein
MLQRNVEDIFGYFNNSVLYKNLQYPLYLSGILDDVEEEILEIFLEQYEFTDDNPLLFDQFVFHFRTFTYVMEKNEIPVIHR